MLLVDTDVLIECLRGSTAAKAWLASQSNAAFGIPGIVAMELVVGCRNQSELRQIQKFLRTFTIIWPDASDFAAAYQLLLTLHSSSSIGIPDCLIASMALARGSRLYKFNLKHFK